MSLTDYVNIIRRRGWIVVVLAVLTAASAYVFSSVQTPIYKSTAFVLVSPARPDFGLTSSAKGLLRSYVAWMTTRSNAQKVINDPALQLDLSADALLGQVTIASDDSRFIIQIDVLNGNGDLANDVARKWAELFVQWRKDENAKIRREDSVDAALLDLPQYSLHRPNKTINTAAGAILGVVLGAVVIFALEYLDAGILRSPSDVERALAVPVLGALPELTSEK